MKRLFFLLCVLFVVGCLPVAPAISAVPAAPTVQTAGTALTPLQQAIAKLAADATLYESTSGSLAAAKSAADAAAGALLALQASASNAAAAVQADTLALAQLIGPVPNPTPGPIVPSVSLLVLSSDACAPCKILEPILAQLAVEGLPVSVSKTDADATRYALKATPTFVMLLGTKEVSRNVGTLDEAQIRDWLIQTQAWAKAGGGK